jgi:ectoine hydroxylase-related dioxygenase (phytanoyl-CoA dioxygenase family)
MIPALAEWFDGAPTAPGTRITRLGLLAPYLTGNGPIARLASDLIGPRARPVRAVAFDKSQEANWALGWHQDRTINVAARAEVEGFGPWTVKQGSQHVQPPFALVETMITLRIHLDPVTPDNAPLEVALGSHRLGYIAEPRVPQVVETSRILACLAQPGDVWAYATPILHASRRSTGTGQRRVLQVDFSAEGLPSPLQWALDLSGNE